jgi:hypothetical protein
VDSILFTACLDRILARTQVGLSNSLIEGFRRDSQGGATADRK